MVEKMSKCGFAEVVRQIESMLLVSWVWVWVISS